FPKLTTPTAPPPPTPYLLHTHTHRRIAILHAAPRIVRINLAQLNLGQDHARQPLKRLVDALARQRTRLHHRRNVMHLGPARRRLARHLARPPLRLLSRAAAPRRKRKAIWRVCASAIGSRARRP